MLFVLAASAMAVTASAVSIAASGNPTPTVPTTPPGKKKGPIPSVLSASAVIKLPSNRKPVTQLRIRIKHPGGLRLRSLSVRIGHRLIKENPKATLLTLKKLPKGSFKVTVKAVTSGGRALVVSRRYRRRG